MSFSKYVYVVNDQSLYADTDPAGLVNLTGDDGLMAKYELVSVGTVRATEFTEVHELKAK